MLRVPSSLVSADWLFEHQSAKNLIIFDATIKKVGIAFEDTKEKKQLKNAVFFDLKNEFSVQDAPFPNTIISANDFQQKVQELGLNNDSCIVVYDDLGVYSSPRVWWLFKTFGFTNIAVLNGGLPEWAKKGYPTEHPTDKKNLKGNFTANYQPKNITFTDDVLKAIQNSEVLIADARSEERFNGRIAEPRPEVKRGYIPSSVNVPFSSLLVDGKMKSTKELTQIFNTFNPQKKQLIFSCGSGITACVLALGAEIAEHKSCSVYDGSWTEWGSTKNLPIENNTMKKDWTRNEFIAYIMLYAAQSNFIQTKEEENYILSKIDEQTYNAMHTEIVHNSDYESVQKIRTYLMFNRFSEEDKKQLLNDIKAVFFADSSVDFLEKNVFQFVKKVLN